MRNPASLRLRPEVRTQLSTRQKYLLGGLAALTALALVLLLFQTFGSRVIYVDQSATGQANGSSWTHAYTDLQDAIDAATTGDEIWVATGTYYPSRDRQGQSQPKKAQAKTFFINKGLALYGGFAGTETDRDDRYIAAFPVILSGDLPGDPAYHVLYLENASGVTLDGFTIRDGKAEGSNQDQHGGGIYASAINGLTYRHLYLLHNQAKENGGAVYHQSINNLTMDHVRICHNEAKFGGGMHNLNVNNYTLTNGTFCDNEADNHGGALYHMGTNVVTIVNTSFTGNQADNHGGAVYTHNSSNFTFTNTTFVGNTADNHGGGLYNVNTNNLAVYNSVFWQNEDQSGTGTADAALYRPNSCNNFSIAYSLMQGSGGSGSSWQSSSTDGGHNLDADPLFADPDGEDDTPCTEDDHYYYTSSSPGIDAGLNSAPGLSFLSLDPAGGPRIVNGTIDVGAFEGTGGLTFPVEWLGFAASLSTDDQAVLLDWATAHEENASHFTIERALAPSGSDLVTWTSLGRVAAAGQSSTIQRYTYRDDALPAPGSATTLLYRLQQVDFDGAYAYSKTVEVWREPGLGEASLRVYPNPSSGPFTLELSLPEGTTASSLALYDLSGRVAFRQPLGRSTHLTQQIDPGQVAPGVYVLSVQTTGPLLSHRLVIR